MSRVAAAHADWLGLLDTHGQFLTLPVLRETMPDGLDRTRPELRASVRDQLAALTSDVADRTAWLEFLLRDVLGWGPRLRGDLAVPAELSAPVAEHNLVLRPDYALVGPAGAGQTGERVRVLVMRFPLGTDLTTRIAGEKWAASPVDRVARLCRATGVAVGIATDTNSLALVSARADTPVGYGIWPTDLLGEEQELLDSLISVLGAKRFFAVRTSHQLESILVESASKEHEVTIQLGKQVRRAVEMLVAALSRANNEHGGRLLVGVDPRAVYESAVTVMMRLVFLLYAEERHLLPLGAPLYDNNFAASTLREQLRAEADTIGDEPLELRASAWYRLLATFRVVHGGITHDQLRLPAYGGSLFDPDRFPFLEGRTYNEPWRLHSSAPIPVDDATVLAALTALQVLDIRDGGVVESRKLSFRTLDVEQIGHVYEGLLDHGAMRVEEVAVGLIGKSGSEAEVRLAAIEDKAAAGRDTLVAWLVEQTGKSPAVVIKALDTPSDVDLTRLLHTACENDAAVIVRVLPYVRLLREDLRGLPMVFLSGSVYVTETTSRRDSGTEYTTKDLADNIVEHTLEPLVFAQVSADGATREHWRLRSSSEILALRVVDPAVGSGAIIVAACRYLADKLVEAWVAEGTAEAPDDLADDVDDLLIEARRAVADQCLYGVDRDPMAVEMAKLSIWLTTMARERPFSFLDHAFRAGDSLLGVTNLRQIEHLHLNPSRAQAQFTFVEELHPLLAAALAKREELESIRVVTVDDAYEKARLNDEANDLLKAVEIIGDVVVGAALSLAERNSSEQVEVRLLSVQRQVAAVLEPGVSTETRNQRLTELQGLAASWLNSSLPVGAPMRQALHWPVAFPEVFRSGGFSAVVGNPPFLGRKYWSSRLGRDVMAYADSLVGYSTAKADLAAVFVRRSYDLLRSGGCQGLLGTSSINSGNSRLVGYANVVNEGATLYRAESKRPWPGSANVFVVCAWFHKGSWDGRFILDGFPVPGIASDLTVLAPSVTGDPLPLADELSYFIGSNNVRGKAFELKAGDPWLADLQTANSPFVRPLYSYDDIASRDPASNERWIVDCGDLGLEQVGKQSPATLQFLDEVVRPIRTPDFLSKYKGLAQRWWQIWSHNATSYRQLRSHDRCIALGVVAKFLSGVDVPTEATYTNKVVLIKVTRSDIPALTASEIFVTWVRKYSKSRGDSRVELNLAAALKTFPLPAKVDETLAELGERWQRALAEFMRRRGVGLTGAMTAISELGDNSAEVQEMRQLRQELDHAAAQAYGWVDLDTAHGAWPTSQGERWTLSPAVQASILERLLSLNYERHAGSRGEARAIVRHSAPRTRSAATRELHSLPLFPALADEDSA